jgi:PiT family inorganic phosphate transporter
MTFLYILIGMVLVFDFINGFHDSANSIATVVSTKVLSPFAAVAMAAFFNFVAFLIFLLKLQQPWEKGLSTPM